jgi:2-dehydropantoate 2-reductase
MKARPRIAIYGAGLIGTYLGGRLHDHAHVRFIARPHVAVTLKKSGLRISDLNGYDKHIPADALDIQTQPDAVRDVDLVLVTVKSAATMNVAHELSDTLASGVPVVSFQNGIRNAAELRASLPGHNVLSGDISTRVRPAS